MGGYGVEEVSTGAREQVDGMVNGTSLRTGPIAGLGASGGGMIMGAETGVNYELVEIGGSAKSDRGWFGEKVLD